MHINQGAKYEGIIESVFHAVYGRWPSREEGDEKEDDDDVISAMSDFFLSESNLDVVAMAADWKKERTAEMNAKAMGDDDETFPQL